MSTSVWLWVVFNAFVLGMLALDLGVFHRKAHVIGKKEAAIWTVVWIALALIFCAGIYFISGSDRALEFLTGYLIEKSLSVDNVFVFMLIFTYFKVPDQYEHKVLFWGVLGALIMRGVLIAAGSVLLERFHWIIYPFGAFLVLAGIKIFTTKEAAVHPEKNLLIKFLRKRMPVTEKYESAKFFIKREGKRFATPLFVVLLAIESTDLIFAVDSIPAIFAVTDDVFVVYTSNVFAILGLRALYFLLAGIVEQFRYLHYGLGVVLGFVGVKMMLREFYKIPIGVSLAFVIGAIGLSIAASILFKPKTAQSKPTNRDWHTEHI
jgi:tellurite resistance protein TerC